jgi:hypothetical protein
MINELTNSLASTNLETKQREQVREYYYRESREELELIKNQELS